MAFFLMLAAWPNAHAQTSGVVADKIIARVDNYIVLLSDLERAYQSIYESGEVPGPNSRCEILQGLIVNKMLMAKAEIDSVVVEEAQVSGELSRRMRYFELQAGGAERLEQAFGKSVAQLREELREQVHEQLVVQRMQQEITSNISVTPAEVKRYFNRIPSDSIPFLAAEVQVGQIVRYPDISDSERLKAKGQLSALRSRIMAGEDFAVLAKEFSQDPGSKKQGGDLGWATRGQFAPEFEASAMTMEVDELSEPIETEFGFHLIQLLERKGDRFRTRHILIRSQSNDFDVARAERFLDSLRTRILSDTISFANAAKEYTDDQASKGSGGMFTDQGTGDVWVSTDALDPIIFFTIDSMKVGSVTKPIRFRTEDGQPAVRIIYYKAYKAPHYADLKGDYQKIYLAALNEKKTRVLREWLGKAKREVFIDVDPAYGGCNIVEEL
jgi:peptidyl-prolyl cis-trans isomerase SurA